MNWYIGQEIVCVKPNKTGELKKDSVYTISGISKCGCNCGGVDLDVGIYMKVPFKYSCMDCSFYGELRPPSFLYFHERGFRPLDELCNISELTEHLETTKPYDV